VRTIAIINQKGGSGKTTTAINLAAALARLGRRTLLVDVDPQSHCALGLAVPESQIDLTIGDAMLAPDHRPPERARLVWEASKDLSLIPSTTRLAGLEAPRGGLAERLDRDRRLALALAHLAPAYDWCLIDCPPFIGLLTFNALRAADEILIPVETGFFALQGAVKQVNTIRALGRKAGTITPYRVLATLHDPQSPLARDILQELGRRFEDRLIPTPIRFDPRLKESVSAGLPIVQHDPESTGSLDYTALAQFYETAPRLQAEPVALERIPADAPQEHNAAPPLTLSRSETPLPVSLGVANRAAELAARARQLAARSQDLSQRLDADPRLARVINELATHDPPPNPEAAPLESLLGARPTSRGVLFLHLAPPRSTVVVAISRDTPGWPPHTHPLRFNPSTGLHEALIPLAPGPCRYRLIIDGQPTLDPRNPLHDRDDSGEPISLVIVPALPHTTNAAIPA
jgi:chromosome partitioning protein